MELITPITVQCISGVEIHSIGDGSCLLHSILRGFNVKYIQSTSLRRRQIVRQVRNALANVLMETIDGKRVYESLGQGEVANLGKTVPELSLRGLQIHFRSSNPLGQESLELISRFLKIDLLIYDVAKGKPYQFGMPNPYKKGRGSVVILYRPGHYNLFGINIKGKLKTLMNFDDSLVSKWCDDN